jgi:hypothetical protein
MGLGPLRVLIVVYSPSLSLRQERKPILLGFRISRKLLFTMKSKSDTYFSWEIPCGDKECGSTAFLVYWFHNGIHKWKCYCMECRRATLEYNESKDALDIFFNGYWGDLRNRVVVYDLRGEAPIVL